MSDISDLTAAIVDRYAIEHEIGLGWMATVYRARDVNRIGSPSCAVVS